MAWTTKKYSFAGLAGALLWVVYLTISTPLILIFGLMAGSIVMPILTVILFSVFRSILNEKGATILLGFVASILFIPLPTFGPPCFLPKIIIVTGGAAFFELGLSFSKNKEYIGNIVGGLLAIWFVAFSTYGFFIWFNVPGSDKFINMIMPLVFVASIEAVLGGFVGQKIFNAIKKVDAINRIGQ